MAAFEKYFTLRGGGQRFVTADTKKKSLHTKSVTGGEGGLENPEIEWPTYYSNAALAQKSALA